MEGIFFSKYLMGTYFSTLVVYYFVISSISPQDQTNDIKKKTEKRTTIYEKPKIRDIIQLIVFLGIIFSIYYYFMKYQFKAITYALTIIIAVLFIIIIPYVIWKFIHYLFVKPFDYELTDTRKNTLCLAGTFMAFVCGTVAKSNTGIEVNKLLSNVEPVISDFIRIGLLTFWYFAVLFFSLAFFLLILHEISIWAWNRIGFDNKIFKRSPQLVKGIKGISFAKTIVKKIHTMPIRTKWKIIIFNILWFICLPIDILVGLMKALIKFIWNSIIIIIFVPPRIMFNTIRRLSTVLSRDQGKTIIIISRLSIVCSLVIVYLVDKYRHVFSSSGSEIYEFMCSVIIIPLIITQLIELKSIQKSIGSKSNREYE